MNDTNPIQVIAWVLSVFLAERIAAAVAPHIAVIIAGCAGAYFGLSSWRKCTRAEAVRYILGFGAWAWFFSAMVASMITDSAVQHSPYVVQICAAALGWLGHRIDSLLQLITPGAKK